MYLENNCIVAVSVTAQIATVLESGGGGLKYKDATYLG
jgi:hypothetical protein